MRLTKFTKTAIFLVAIGAGMVVIYGFPDLLLIRSSWQRGLRWAGILFLFGVWAGMVLLTEELSWRRALHSVTFASVGLVAAEVLANPTVTEVLITMSACAIVGYFGELWIQHV